MQKMVQIKNLTVNYPVSQGLMGCTKGYVHALDKINLDIYKGEVLGLVGESGCGKSTLSKAVLQLIEYEGDVFFEGRNLSELEKSRLKDFRKRAQMIFQNPYSSLDPRMNVYDILREPLVVHGIKKRSQIRERIFEILNLTGLDEESLKRYPHEFSGGQRQRIAIARALVLEPEFLVADEPVSALDVSIQAQIIQLLLDLKEKLNLTILFVSHDLGVVKYISDRIAVMYLGSIIETGESAEVFENPKHPYTKALISAVPSAFSKEKSDFIKLEGDLPSVNNPPCACKFHTRCPKVMEICKMIAPEDIYFSKTHFAKCHLYDSEVE